jgi:hypothetical protein
LFARIDWGHDDGRISNNMPQHENNKCDKKKNDYSIS